MNSNCEQDHCDIATAAVAQKVWEHTNLRMWRAILDALAFSAGANGLVFVRSAEPMPHLSGCLVKNLAQNVIARRYVHLNPATAADDLDRYLLEASADGYDVKFLDEVLDSLRMQGISLRDGGPRGAEERDARLQDVERTVAHAAATRADGAGSRSPIVTNDSADPFGALVDDDDDDR